MTTNETPNDALAPLAELIANADDPLAWFEALQPVLAPAMLAALMLSFDLCPIHMQDLDSCRDDDTIGDLMNDTYDVPLSACRSLRS